MITPIEFQDILHRSGCYVDQVVAENVVARDSLCFIAHRYSFHRESFSDVEFPDIIASALNSKFCFEYSIASSGERWETSFIHSKKIFHQFVTIRINLNNSLK